MPTVNSRPYGFIFYLSLLIYLQRMFLSPTDYSDFFTHYASVFLSPQRGHTLVVTAGNPTVGRLPADKRISPPSRPQRGRTINHQSFKKYSSSNSTPSAHKKAHNYNVFYLYVCDPFRVGRGGGFLLSVGGSFSTRPPTVTTSCVSFGDLLPVFLRPFDQP